METTATARVVFGIEFTFLVSPLQLEEFDCKLDHLGIRNGGR
jgi:hypothetical protein